MKSVLLLFLALPLSAATISISPSTPKAGDSVVVTIHDTGDLCRRATTITAKLNGQTLQVEVIVPPTACQLACPTVPVPVTYTTPAVTLPDAQPYSIEYAVTDCDGNRRVVDTKQVLVTPTCAFDRSVAVTRTTSGALNFTWCDPSYSPFPDFGQFANAYRIYLVRESEAPILVQEQSSGTSATVALTNREAGARSAFVEASLCEVTVAGCRGETVVRSNVFPLDVAPADLCSLGGAALCLANRFSVTARFHTDGGSSPAHPVPVTSDSGYFWFFGPNNAEIVMKIVDACSLSSNFWFFAAGMTDVGVDLVVTDTKTGAVRRYSNPSGTAFTPIQDTNAFAGCQ
ncbi:MAG TPA: hypothetical protein VG323_09330 [Thermoanaerobaculia bacterium]|nr:hypothetical protein [Thermoanaerobaculia bacterium]